MSEMSVDFCSALTERSRKEAYAGLLGMEVARVEPGRAVVRMKAGRELFNIFGAIHGAALFSVIDEAFQLACNTHGTLAVALNVSITYCAAPKPDCMLEADVKETNLTRRTGTYSCDLRQVEDGKLIATALALAYRTGKDSGLQAGEIDAAP
jgi:acyl-CoA thioesterase